MCPFAGRDPSFARNIADIVVGRKSGHRVVPQMVRTTFGMRKTEQLELGGRRQRSPAMAGAIEPIRGIRGVPGRLPDLSRDGHAAGRVDSDSIDGLLLTKANSFCVLSSTLSHFS